MSEPDRTSPPPATRRAARAGWLLFAVCLLVYNTNLRGIGSYDSLATGILPFNLWRGEGLSLDRYGALTPDIGYSMARGRDGTLRIAYPIVTSLLVAPLYAPAAFFPEFNADSIWRVVMEKVSASLLASLAVLVLYRALLALTTGRRALLLAALFAFGTDTWMVSSQALWQHGAGELLLASGLALLLRPHLGRLGIAGLGIAAGLTVANRPADIFLGGALLLAASQRWRRRSAPAWSAAAAVAGGLVAFNLWSFGSLIGGYGLVSGIAFGGYDPAATAGLLLGARGLLVFCPFLLALIAARALPRPLGGAGWILAGGWLATLILYSCFQNWAGGFSYGPRYLTDGLPILFLFLARALERPLRPAARTLFVLAACFAVSSQTIGAFCFPSGNSGDLGETWRWESFAPVAALAGGPATPDFAPIVKPGLRDRAALAPSDQLGLLELVEAPPATARRLQYVPISLRIENHGTRTWSSVGTWMGLHAVRLDISFVKGDTPVAPPGSFRADYWLAFRLGPGESLTRSYWVRTPNQAGRWRLEIEPGQRTPTFWAPFAADRMTPIRRDITITP